MKSLLAITAALSLAACASVEHATYKDYPKLSAEKRAECRAKAEPIYWQGKTNDAHMTGLARLKAANAFEQCMES
jgi:uncharacterized lipoprotein YmbA